MKNNYGMGFCCMKNHHFELKRDVTAYAVSEMHGALICDGCASETMVEELKDRGCYNCGGQDRGICGCWDNGQ